MKQCFNEKNVNRLVPEKAPCCVLDNQHNQYFFLRYAATVPQFHFNFSQVRFEDHCMG